MAFVVLVTDWHAGRWNTCLGICGLRRKCDLWIVLHTHIAASASHPAANPLPRLQQAPLQAKTVAAYATACQCCRCLCPCTWLMLMAYPPGAVAQQLR